MKKFKLISILILIALAGVAIWFFGFKEKEKPIELETEQPQYGYIAKSVTATGTLEPVDTVSVGSQESGTIKAIYADFNSKVKKGQLIAELDKSLLSAQADQYKANLQVAKSQMVYAQSTFDRQNLLYQTGAISKADFETAQYTLNSARANVASVQAQVNAAEKNLSYANIYSPVDGVVMTRNVSMGQTVAASFNTPTLFVIAKDIKKMQVQGAVDQADIGNVTQGQRVTFTVDAYPDDVFRGTVEEIRLEPTVSSNVVTYSTIISAPNDNLKLKPGMTANITVFTKEEDSALLIPAKALKYKPDEALAKQYKIIPLNVDSSGQHRTHQTRSDTSAKKAKDSSDVVKKTRGTVWVLQGDSLVQKRVVTGMNDDTNVEILRGLIVNDVVVTATKIETTKSKGSTTQKSPFMPQRGGGNRPSSAAGSKPKGK
jgi:HlyD family secretion protein